MVLSLLAAKQLLPPETAPPRRADKFEEQEEKEKKKLPFPEQYKINRKLASPPGMTYYIIVHKVNFSLPLYFYLSINWFECVYFVCVFFKIQFHIIFMFLGFIPFRTNCLETRLSLLFLLFLICFVFLCCKAHAIIHLSMSSFVC